MAKSDRERYMAPVSRKAMERRVAISLAVEDLPVPEGPSRAIT